MISFRSKKSGSFSSLRTERGSTSIRLFLVLTIIVLIGISVGMRYGLLRQPRLANLEEPIKPVKLSPASSGPSLADINAWLTTGTGAASWSTDEFVRAILALDSAARADVLAKLTDDFRSSPAKWSAFVEKLATAWAGQAPGPAIFFLDSLHDQSGNKYPSTHSLESKLLSEWVGRDFPGVSQYLKQVWQQQSSLPSSQLDLLVSIVQNEQKAKFGDMLNWVDSLKAGEDRPLKMAASEALARMGQAENFQSITDLLGKNITDLDSAKCVGQFAARNAIGSSGEGIQWLKKLAPNVGLWGPVIIGDFFDQLGRNDPTTAVKLINSGFTDSFVVKEPASITETPGATSPTTPEQLYDLALSKVVKNVMVLDPNYALICSEYFNDPRLQAQYAKTVQRLMISSARQSH